uniref:Uncharacterized protein n=1 Tax=Anguilla anguilla TaxID=7936 RepID=A0A0E9PLU9_ANGAN
MCSGMCWKHSVNLESLHKSTKGLVQNWVSEHRSVCYC